ncbi:hypothetical protein PoB_006044900 [Plakobranchus ocellatus]|uniref:Uncharacterized protein n=1 Tax=Plakobranchus ocellatus TaxID=259542 RepID=A0AAV4CQ02_9GAST|nr:hypothetical protein PoB_006044900 [Plakobranchus ocellatus]
MIREDCKRRWLREDGKRRWLREDGKRRWFREDGKRRWVWEDGKRRWLREDDKGRCPLFLFLPPPFGKVTSGQRPKAWHGVSLSGFCASLTSVSYALTSVSVKG